MSARELWAAAVASALLAGEWRQAAMMERASAAVTKPTPGLRRLVRELRRAFPRRPRDAPDALASWIAAHETASRAIAGRAHRIALQLGPVPPIVVRWIVAPSAMAPPRSSDRTASWTVPRIDTTGDLARWLGVSTPRLDWFADRRDLLRRARDEALHHHRREWVSKPSGGARLIEAPKAELARMQRKILHDVLDAMPAHAAAHGFRRGRDVGTFVAPHVGRTLVVRLDLEDFFASVSAPRVLGIFRTAGYAEEVARTITALCTTRTPSHVLRAMPRDGDGQAGARARARLRVLHLAQGAPTSPALASLAAFRLDARMQSLAIAMDGVYTRYADDLAISFAAARSRAAVDCFLRLATTIVSEEGFRVATHKTRVMRRGARQHLAGLVVNERPGVPREDYDRLRAILHLAARTGPTAQNRAHHPEYRAHLRGRIEWIGSWSPRRAAKLMRLFDAIDWTR